jgi:serine/threonine protein kinase
MKESENSLDRYPGSQIPRAPLADFQEAAVPGTGDRKCARRTVTAGLEKETEEIVLQSIGGRYQLTHQLGIGGMGIIFGAIDSKLGRRVAIKVLKAAGDAESLNRFHMEATSAANLNHPNIVTVYDYGDFEGEPYIVMEYMDGQDLQRALDSGKQFDLVQIAEIISQVADALNCAHDAGVIHRDVSPRNIMILSQGAAR